VLFRSAMVALVLVDALMQHHAQCELFPRENDLENEIISNNLGRKL